MIINTTMVGVGFLAFAGIDPSSTWLWLLAFAIVADAFNVLTKPFRINMPVVGLADLEGTAKALGEIAVRKDGKPFAEIKSSDGSYL